MTLASKASAQNGGEENGRRLSLAGQVVESVTREPLAGATIQVLGTRQGGISNAEGRFQIFNIPAGTYQVRISSVGYQTVVKTDVVVSNARPASLDVELVVEAKLQEEVVVRPEYFQRSPDAVTSVQTLSSEEIRRLPGGFEDVVRAG